MHTRPTSIILPLAALALSSPPVEAQQLIYSTGPQKHVINQSTGAATNLGLSSGCIATGPQRWLVAPFTLPPIPAGANRWRVLSLLPCGFVPAGVSNASLNYILWNRTGLNKPVDGDQILAGMVPFPAPFDDPADSADNASHPISTDFNLDAADFYLTVYASHPDNPTVQSNFAWFVSAPDGIAMADAEGPFRWRSSSFPTPGFERWTLGNYVVQGGDDPSDLWNVTFRIHGEPVFDPEFDSDGDGSPDGSDGCPADPAKTAPGTCGCGIADRDSDADGVVDCVDACPADGQRTEPGLCGCGGRGRDHDDDGVEECCLGSVPACCLGDVNGDGTTGAEDLAEILFRWGTLAPDDRACDLDGNGLADGVDLSLLIAGWGPCS